MAPRPSGVGSSPTSSHTDSGGGVRGDGGVPSLDPSSTVNHIGLQRANRYVAIPPGTISHITFFVKTATGQVIDLQALGAGISFVITIAERGDA